MIDSIFLLSSKGEKIVPISIKSSIHDLLKNESNQRLVESKKENIIKEFNFNIMGLEKGNAYPVKLGEVKGYYVQTSKLTEWEESVSNLFSSEGLRELYRVLTKTKKIQSSLVEDTYFIEEITVDNKFRNQRIGSLTILLLKQLLREVYNLHISNIILKAFPIELEKAKDEDFEIGLEFLIQFYSRLGFETINRDNYMVLDYKNIA